MGLFSKTNKKETKENGYISFTEEDLREQAQNNQANAEAYELLDAAMTTSSHITQKDKEGNTVNIDDIYPCTLQECDEMDGLLDQAEAAVRDPNDKIFKERLGELRDIVDWSRKKHWTFKWPLIFGCIVSIFLLNWCKSDADDTAKRADREYEMIDNWKEQDTTIQWNKCEALPYNVNIYQSANTYKNFKLATLKGYYNRVKNDAEVDEGRIAYAENKHDKDSIQKHMKGLQDQMAKYKSDYDEINALKFKELKKEALKQAEHYKDSANSDAKWITFYLIFCIILIPLYIWTSHQPGYYITLHRTEGKALGCIQKVGFSIAGFLLGSGLAMSLLPDYEVTTHYSDGSTSKHTEFNSGNYIILAIKFMMMAAGILMYCFISLVIMTYATFVALKRNYDWGKMAQQAAVAVSDTVQKTAAAVKEKQNQSGENKE